MYYNCPVLVLVLLLLVSPSTSTTTTPTTSHPPPTNYLATKPVIIIVGIDYDITKVL